MDATFGPMWWVSEPVATAGGSHFSFMADSLVFTADGKAGQA